MREMLDRRMSGDEIRQWGATCNDKTSVATMIDLMHDDNERIASNAAWILTHASEKNKKLLNNYQNELIDLAINSKNETLQRLSLSLLEHQDFSIETMRSDFIDFCLSSPLDINVKPGVINQCIKIGYKQCKLIPELLHEYIAMLNMMQVEHYATSVKSIRRKMLKTISTKQ